MGYLPIPRPRESVLVLDGVRVLEVRPVGEEPVDVSGVAVHFGGGGERLLGFLSQFRGVDLRQ